MNTWIVTIYEPLPFGHLKTRPQRCGMLAKALLERGHNVELWTSGFDHVNHKHYHQESKLQIIGKRISIQFIKGCGYNYDRSIKRLFHNRETGKEFTRLANAKKKAPDIIFAPVPILELAEAAVKYGKKNNIPVVVDLRDLWPDVYLTFFPKSFYPIARLLFSSEFRRAEYLFKNASAITAISNEYLKKGLSYAGRLPRHVDRFFPLGSKDICNTNQEETPKYTSGFLSDYKTRPKGQFIITYIGTFSKFIDIQCILDAARVLLAYEEIRIIIVGSGDCSDDFHNQAKELANVTMTGWLDADAVRPILKQTSVGLVAYSKDATMTLPNKAFEYMAAGLPLLSSLEGELKAIVEQEGIGLQYKASDPIDLRDKIIWFFSHPYEAKIMGHRARKLFEKKYNADNVYATLVKHLEKVVSERDRINERQ